MSISSAFGVSQSGLTTVAKQAEVVSGNVANADTVGYTKKSAVQATTVDGGVSVIGIRRASDPAMDKLYRSEFAAYGSQNAVSSGLEFYTSRLGSLDDPHALNTLMSKLETSLAALSGAPGDTALQSAVLSAATGLTRELNGASDALAETTALVGERVADDVASVNGLLEDITDLNVRIAGATPGSSNHADLTDALHVKLDSLSEFADTSVRFNQDGMATVFTAGGTQIVDGRDHKTFSYDAATGVLTAGDVDVTPGRPGARGFSDGSLAGNIQLLNSDLPEMRQQLDELARGLVEAFEGADASLAPGAAGLFTDAGAAYSAAALDGLAGRIEVNTAVDPNQGGALWRLRDGVGAAVEGPSGDNSQVLAFAAVFSADQSFDASAGLGSADTLAGYAAALITDHQTRQSEAEASRDSYRASANTVAANRSGAMGVNVDSELQQLVMIEQAYAANSQVLRVLNEMLDTLMNAV